MFLDPRIDDAQNRHTTVQSYENIRNNMLINQYIKV